MLKTSGPLIHRKLTCFTLFLAFIRVRGPAAFAAELGTRLHTGAIGDNGRVEKYHKTVFRDCIPPMHCGRRGGSLYAGREASGMKH